jgi:hypothetical protein
MFNEIALPSRRRLLKYGGSVFITGVMGAFSKSSGDLTVSKDRPYWRFCNKCYAMFYNGYSGKGRCAAGAGHVAQGYNFVLPHSR